MYPPVFLCHDAYFSTATIIYKDIFSDNEMFSDSFRFETIQVEDYDLFYEVEGKVVHENSENVGVVDIVLNHHLQEVNFTWDQYQTDIGKYARRIRDHLQEEHRYRVDGFTVAAQNGIRDMILDNFDDWEFFTGESHGGTINAIG
uniref:TCTP domain-containing protein n=1 Tax=Branchiostoma floridae TaxID=7739 RepID=C3YCE8_BRAFL|eukprot:XP_002605975.1 hypothetical protein BRAFLDRAFT_92197 [Branchiostoma floridae]